jgi:hypothetical protein
MVVVYTNPKTGFTHHEPPYTEEEEWAIYPKGDGPWIMSGPVQKKRADALPPQSEDPLQPPEE